MTIRPLTDYRGIFAVDAVSYTQTPDADQPELGAEIKSLVRNVFIDCGLADVYPKTPQDCGDGVLFSVAHNWTSFLLQPVLVRLQQALEERNEMTPRYQPALRLRVAVGLGLAPADVLASDAINRTCRLLNADQIKDEMDCSDDRTTLVSAIVSDEVLQKVVGGGFSDLRPTEFRPVSATVQGKAFEEDAWIYTPRPSAREQAPGHDAVLEVAPKPSDEGVAGLSVNNAGALIGQQNNNNTHQKISSPVILPGVYPWNER
ncbi:hypothetical protein [Actinocorallia libanotica]|uniref:Guanylate cyclase domain-containing protein n=1 Tax=Actinocorallia libanotica TaxID=46162 RepID=A0ABP4CQQ8_9ACTN